MTEESKSALSQEPLGGYGVDSFDIYIRMNDDPEKDFCFSVNKNAQVSRLMEIFKTLPLILSPSYFYERYPIGFKISKQAGFLTSEGALLFTKTADDEQFLAPVDGNKPFADQIWEGQLFVPIWQPDHLRLMTISSLLLGWLYLDLPQHLTPTPGLGPTILLMKLFDKIFGTNVMGMDSGSSSPFETVIWEWVFFAFHILKIFIIWVFFYFGGINPNSFNPLKARNVQEKEMTSERLLSLGWTGSRRIPPRDWREENRKYRIDAVGGIAAAYQQGILSGLASAGVLLGPGEGFDTPLTNVAEGPLSSDGKFLLSPQYFKTLYKPIATELRKKDLEDRQKDDLLRSFRRTGPLDGPPALQKAYKERKALGFGEIKAS